MAHHPRNYLRPTNSAPHPDNAHPKRQPRSWTTHTPQTPKHSIHVQRMAARLASRLPHLATGHIGRLCTVIENLPINHHEMTADKLIALLDQRNTAQGLYALPARTQRNPLALFTHQALTQHATTPATVSAPQPPRYVPETPPKTDEHATQLALASIRAQLKTKRAPHRPLATI